MKFSKIVASLLIVSSIFVGGCNKVESNDNIDISSNETIVEAYESLIQEQKEEIEELKEASLVNIHYTEVENSVQEYNGIEYDVEALKEKNQSDDLESDDLEEVDIYSNKNIDDVNDFESIDSLKLYTQLPMHEKLFILCDKIEQSLKKETQKDISLHVVDIIDGKYAVVEAVEKYRMGDYDYRKREIEYTLNQVKLKDGWFDKVIVVYDSHSSQ